MTDIVAPVLQGKSVLMEGRQGSDEAEVLPPANTDEALCTNSGPSLPYGEQLCLHGVGPDITKQGQATEPLSA